MQAGLIEHTAGWPLDGNTYGGSFLYHLDHDRVYVGYVVGLDYQDPRLQPFEAFQQFKHHPSVKPLLEGGEILAAGARTIAAGGWQSLPQLEMPGALLIGDAGGTLNVPKIKGIHQAIRSGVCAAEHLAEAGSPAGFDARWRASPGGRELYQVRNIKPGFKRGFWWGFANGALETLTAGHLPWTLSNRVDDAAQLQRLDAYQSPDRHWVTRTLPPRDRLSSVFFAGNTHEENQPVHLKVADTSICADPLRAGVRQSLRALLPGERLRDGRRRPGRQDAAHQCRQLRALQSLRHQGSRTASSPGPRPRAVPGRTTRIFEIGSAMNAASLPLDSWGNFYVIIGSSAGGLTGLTFVVIALVSDAQTVKLSGLRAYITPTVVHFCSVLGIAALLNVPGQTPASLGFCLGDGNFDHGVSYGIGTILQLHRNRPLYVPVAEDWIWNAMLPTLCYLMLLIAGTLAPWHAPIALYATAGVSLLLLFIGIHNAWDIAVWFTAQRVGRPRPGRKKAAAPYSAAGGERFGRKVVGARGGDGHLRELADAQAAARATRTTPSISGASAALRDRHVRVDGIDEHAQRCRPPPAVRR